jgi:hypothetical protein
MFHGNPCEKRAADLGLATLAEGSLLPANLEFRPAAHRKRRIPGSTYVSR